MSTIKCPFKVGDKITYKEDKWNKEIMPACKYSFVEKIEQDSSASYIIYFKVGKQHDPDEGWGCQTWYHGKCDLMIMKPKIMNYPTEEV